MHLKTLLSISGHELHCWIPDSYYKEWRGVLLVARCSYWKNIAWYVKNIVLFMYWSLAFIFAFFSNCRQYLHLVCSVALWVLLAWVSGFAGGVYTLSFAPCMSWTSLHMWGSLKPKADTRHSYIFYSCEMHLGMFFSWDLIVEGEWFLSWIPISIPQVWVQIHL